MSTFSEFIEFDEWRVDLSEKRREALTSEFVDKLKLSDIQEVLDNYYTCSRKERGVNYNGVQEWTTVALLVEDTTVEQAKKIFHREFYWADQDDTFREFLHGIYKEEVPDELTESDRREAAMTL